MLISLFPTPFDHFHFPRSGGLILWYDLRQNQDLNHDDPGLAPMVVVVCQRHSYSGSKPGGRVSRLIRISFPQNDRVKKDFEKMKRQMFEIRQGFHLKGNVSAFEMI